MHRINKAFLALCLLLAVFGGVATADYSQTLGTLEDAGLVASQVETSVVSGEVNDGRFVLAVEVQNPTRFALQLNGAYMSASENGKQVAYGTVTNHGEIPATIPPRETVAVTYEFALSDSQAEELRAGLENGTVDISGRHAVQLSDTQFSIDFTGEVGNA